MEESDDDSYMLLDYEELWDYVVVEHEEENFSEEKNRSVRSDDTDEMDSSSCDTDYLFDKALQFINSPYEKVDNFTSFPPFPKKREEMTIEDLVKDYVLPFLSAKSLIRFRSVSKHWDHRIRSPFLAHQQSYCFQDMSGFFCQWNGENPKFVTLNHAAYGVPRPSLTFLPELVNIISSSNGLLLCQGRNENKLYYICNPANKDWKELPEPEYYHGSEPAIVLAFEPAVLNMEAHYQLICAVSLLDQPIVYFEIYSSETRSWRRSDTICVELGNSSFTGNGFYMKGMAYWVLSTGKVLAFDLKNEVHGVISLPSESPPRGVLAQIHEELSYVCISHDSGNEYAIKIYGGVDLSLRRTIDILLEPVPESIRGYRVLPSVDGNSVMMLIGSSIYSYNLSGHRIELISREGIDSLYTTRYLPYVNSLVPVA